MIGDRPAGAFRNAADCAPRISDFGLSSLGHWKRDLWEPCTLKSSNPKGVDDGFSEHLSVVVQRCDSTLLIEIRYEVQNTRR